MSFNSENSKTVFFKTHHDAGHAEEGTTIDNQQPEASTSTNQHIATRGGFTCCVPLCYNNSKDNDKSLSFYVIPKDPELRKKWLHMISRKNFKPTSGHRVCSEHFVGGKKTYDNNVPTIVPKIIKPTKFKERKSRNSLGLLQKDKPQEEKQENICSNASENDLFNELKHEINYLKEQLKNKELQLEESKSQSSNEIATLKEQLASNKFSLDRFKHNEGQFKFYTGFETYEIFNVFYQFLQPGACSLIYWGSVTNVDFTTTEPSKYGRSRILQPQEELFLTLGSITVWLTY